MATKCLVCYSSTECVAYLINDNIQFPSGKRLLDIFTKIFDVTTQEVVTQKYSQVICRKCLISFVEFDEYNTQLAKLKSDMKAEYQSSYKKFILRDAQVHSPTTSDTGKVQNKKSGPTTSKNEPVPTTTESDPIIIDVSTFSELMKLTSGHQPPMLTLDGLSPNVTITAGDSTGNKGMGFVKLEPVGEVSNKGIDVEKECGYPIYVRSQTQDSHQEVMSVDNSKNQMDCDESGDRVADKYVIDKVEIVDGDDAGTVMIEGENGSLIKVVAGKELFYGDNQISLVLPQDSTQDHNYDNNDSNDESQIELQMSGDEETANAIIAATKEHGGAFIKINSGEMYRVEAVKSSTVKIEDIKLEDIMDINETQTAYTCLLCKKTEDNQDTELDSTPNPAIIFPTTAAISKHLNSLHKLYVCVSCRTITDDVNKYNKHLRTHEKMKGKFQCTECFKRFFSANLLSQHQNCHNGSKPFSCHYCNKSFASKYTCQTHVKIHQERPRPFKCKTCNKTFLSAQNLNQHVKTHEGVKDHICNVCGKGFAAKHNLEVHSVVHSGEKPFICGVCSKGFARKAEIRDHIRTHTGERPFVCEICGAAFSQRSNLLSHKRATHLDDRRYKCDQCDKRFKRRRLLVYHIKSTHTGERPFTCQECKATFVYPEHYKKHIKIHTGVRPYNCEVCGKSFISRDNRNAHRYIHSEKKPYECLICGAGFMRKPLLYLHMSMQGHMSESIVVNEPYMRTDRTVVNDTMYEAVNEQEFKAVNSNKEEIILEASNETSVEELEKNTVSIDASFIENAALQNIVAQDKALSEDGSEAVVRLVQVQLPNGNNGWIALDQ